MKKNRTRNRNKQKSRPKRTRQPMPQSPNTTAPPTPPPTPPTPQTPPTPSVSTPTTTFAIHPPRRSYWAPFSYASTELNLLARPDYDTVCHAIFQTFQLGAIFPSQNPPRIKLPPLKPPQVTPSLPALPPRNNVQTPPRSPSIHSGAATPFSTPQQTPKLSKTPTNAPVDSPWATFKFSPRPITRTVEAQKAGLASKSELMEIFSAKVPMTPVRARADSPYVSTRDHSVLIHPIAYAQDNGKGPHILCRAIINPSYQPDVGDGRVVPTLTYVGFEYADLTCLTYVPIRDTRLVYRVSCRRDRWFGEEVQMILRRSVYERIKEMCVRAYLEFNPGVKVDCGSVEFQGVNVMLFVMVKANRTVKIEMDGRTVYRPLLETLNSCKHDITGEALLHVRFSKTPGRAAVQLKFILFGIQATRTESNKTLRIFEMAENEGKSEGKNEGK